MSDTRTFATGPPASALTTRPPNSTVTVSRLSIGWRRRTGGGQLSAVASNAGDDARTNRDEAKMSQHIPAPVLTMREARELRATLLLPGDGVGDTTLLGRTIGGCHKKPCLSTRSVIGRKDLAGDADAAAAGK